MKSLRQKAALKNRHIIPRVTGAAVVAAARAFIRECRSVWSDLHADRRKSRARPTSRRENADSEHQGAS